MNIGDKAKQILSAVAPYLGTAIGGPFGAMAGSILSTALGTPAGDAKAAEAALLNASPETLLAVRKGEQDFTVRMEELGIKREQLVFDDRANARAREIQVRDNTPRILAYVLIGGTMLVIVCTLMGWTRAESVTAGTLIGYLISECKAALQYYFGSSSGSEKKTDTLSEIAKMP